MDSQKLQLSSNGRAGRRGQTVVDWQRTGLDAEILRFAGGQTRQNVIFRSVLGGGRTCGREGEAEKYAMRDVRR